MGVVAGAKFTNSFQFKTAMLKASKDAAKVLPMTLTGCAFEARRGLMSDLPKRLHQPVPFTVRGVRYGKAKYGTKRPFSTVSFMPTQWKYMKYAVLGGTRSGPTLSAPVAASTNSYGNTVAGQRESKLRGRKGYFRAKIGGHDGLWSRSGDGLRMMHVYKSSMRYEKRLPMQYLVYKHAAKAFPSKYKDSWRRTIKKATGV